MAERRIATPEANPETTEYWRAANDGRLLIRRCTSCGEPHHYPRTLCPFCFSDATVWEQVSGGGTVYSCSVLRRVDPPYCIAYVTLDEGPTMLSNIVDCDLDSVRIGARVQVVFKPSEGGQLVPMFAPAAP